MKNRFIKLSIMAAVVFGGILAANVYADTVLSSLIVSPPYQRIILIPGETYNGSLQISNSNESQRDLKYSVAVGSFSEHKEEGARDRVVVDHVTRSSYNQMMDWITLGKEKGVVPPNETDVLTYSIKVPEDAPAGGQYATILVRDDTNKGDGGDGNIAIQNVVQFASVIYAEVAGETTESGKITENSIPSVLFNAPLSVSSVVKNSGNVHTDAEYTLQVWPLFSGEEVYSNTDKPMTSLILPGVEKYNVQTWDEAPMVGIFKVKQTVKIYDDVSTVEKMVIICPLWLIIIIVIAIVAVIVFVAAKIRNSRKN